KSFRIAEKSGHADKHVLIELVSFGCIASKVIEIAFQGMFFAQNHPSVDASLKSSGLVKRKVHTGMLTKQDDYPLEILSVSGFLFCKRTLTLRRPTLHCLQVAKCEVGMPRDFNQFLRDIFRRENKVNATRCDGALRHAGVLRGLVLRKRDPA